MKLAIFAHAAQFLATVNARPVYEGRDADACAAAVAAAYKAGRVRSLALYTRSATEPWKPAPEPVVHYIMTG